MAVFCCFRPADRTTFAGDELGSIYRNRRNCIYCIFCRTLRNIFYPGIDDIQGTANPHAADIH